MNTILDIIDRHIDKFQEQELGGKRGFAIACLKQVIRQDLEVMTNKGSKMANGMGIPSPIAPDHKEA